MALGELVVLGSAGWIPQEGRMTTSLALRLGDDLLVFDAGSGVSRLGREPYRRLLPEAGRTIHLFLTHLHLDHLLGLTFLPALWGNPTQVHVPVGDATGAGVEILDSLFGTPFFPRSFENLLPSISRDVQRPGERRVAGQHVTARLQEHNGGSLGYRVGDMLAFVTDCARDAGTVDFVRGARLLVHEAWTSEMDDPGGARARAGGHSSAEEAARVAAEAGVEELLLCHLPPTGEAYHEDMLAGARALFPRTFLCVDGTVRTLG